MPLVARLEAHAEELRRAARSGKPILPLTDNDPDLTVVDAYAIQLANVDHLVAAGHRVLGHKVGLTSKAMQEMLGVNEPDFGVLTDDMIVDDGASIDLARMIQPRVEAEIGLVLAHDLQGPGVTTAEALHAVGFAVAALEIIDSRIADWRIRLVDTVADNGSSGRFVLGPQKTTVDGIDLRLVGMAFSRNGTIVDAGAGAAVLGHPARCVAWLANKLAEFGTGLRAGQIVMPGALHRAVDASRGDVFLAEYSQLGAVRVRFDDSREEGRPD
jgi:2-keto-4-pentenoate hydratase